MYELNYVSSMLESLLASCRLLLSSLPATCSCSSETYSFRPVRPSSWLLLLTLQLQIPVELGSIQWTKQHAFVPRSIHPCTALQHGRSSPAGGRSKVSFCLYTRAVSQKTSHKNIKMNEWKFYNALAFLS